MTLRTRHAALVAALALGLAACPGRLDNIEDFVGSTRDSGAQTCTLGVSAVESQIIRPRCATSGCHDRGQRAGGLDLESPDITARVLNVRASTCNGQVLVTSGGGGFFIEKLDRAPRCGDRMPLGSMPLASSELTCVRLWLASLRADAGAPPDVPMDIPRDAPMDIVRDMVVADNLPNDGRVEDAPRDTTAMDTPGDVRPVDAETFDGGVDAEGDAQSDVAADLTMDAGIDAPDAGTDVVNDTPLDRETSSDASPDRTTPNDSDTQDVSSRDAADG
jgi:hypothetical protein